jgi:hypothetical protein
MGIGLNLVSLSITQIPGREEGRRKKGVRRRTVRQGSEVVEFFASFASD